MEDCVFCKIVKGEIPSKFLYQDDKIAVFPDKNPGAPIHILLVPKEHIADLTDAPEEIISAINQKIKDFVKEGNFMEKGYRIVINGGTAKAVPHLHFHLLGEISKERTV